MDIDRRESPGMDVLTAMLTRRSQHRLTEPAPDNGEFAELLAIAATAPDHGQLRPWRWLLVRGAGRDALGECFAADVDAARAGDAAAKPLRAPLLATLVFQPRPGHRVPEWEQLAATSLMSHAMMLLLHERGYGSIWRTGSHTDSPAVRALLGLGPDERALGWLYIGSPINGRLLPPRTLPDVAEKVTALRHHASVDAS
ncbi:nitroreductase family protein [Dactylosporangium sp. McL0621]|uniref:nitroreductase family protein n=1 Tax=Dactylosporangium sp. McL0621 TaxID=3415678 RepID=UPI003CF8661D